MKAWLVAATVVACGCANRGVINTHCAEVGASADRSTLVYADKDRVVRLRGAERSEIRAADAGCLGGIVDSVFVYPDGERAVVYGSRDNIDFDLWGHGGRHVSASCLVSFADRTARPAALSGLASVTEAKRGELRLVSGVSGVIYAWRPGQGWNIEAVKPGVSEAASLATPESGATCVVTDDGEVAQVACLPDFGEGAKSMALTRYSLASWPPREVSRATVAVAPYVQLWGMSSSADGTRVAYWGRDGALGNIGNLWGVVDVSRGRELLRKSERYRGAVSAIEIDPRGASGYLVADWVGGDHGGMEGRLRRFDAAGKQLVSRHVDSAPEAVYWSEPGRAWYAGTCELRRVDLGD